LIQDQNILYSVKNHTLCDKNMNLFAVIILLADKIEPNRNFPEVKILRKLAYDNI
jgi:HD superfamily phosphohydrolase YqeK